MVMVCQALILSHWQLIWVQLLCIGSTPPSKISQGILLPRMMLTKNASSVILAGNHSCNIDCNMQLTIRLDYSELVRQSDDISNGQTSWFYKLGFHGHSSFLLLQLSSKSVDLQKKSPHVGADGDISIQAEESQWWGISCTAFHPTTNTTTTATTTTLHHTTTTTTPVFHPFFTWKLSCIF